LEGTFTSFFKNKSRKEVTKQYESKFFLLFCMIIEGSGSGSTALTNGSGSRRPKKHRDPVDSDSDPEHCKKENTDMVKRKINILSHADTGRTSS
jgi:hypothetical protein